MLMYRDPTPQIPIDCVHLHSIPQHHFCRFLVSPHHMPDQPAHSRFTDATFKVSQCILIPNPIHPGHSTYPLKHILNLETLVFGSNFPSDIHHLVKPFFFTQSLLLLRVHKTQFAPLHLIRILILITYFIKRPTSYSKVPFF